MLHINTNSSPTNNAKSPEIATLVERKQIYFQEVIQRTILFVNANKTLGLIGAGEVAHCLNTLLELTNKLQSINTSSSVNIDNAVIILQSVNNDLSSLFKIYGTNMLEDFLAICFGSNYLSLLNLSEYEKSRFEILKNTFHPTSYKILTSTLSKEDKDEDKNKEDKKDKEKSKLNEKSLNFDCCDLSNNYKQFHYKVYGIQTVIHNHSANKSLLVTGFIDDISLSFLNNKFITNKLRMVKELMPLEESNTSKKAMFEKFLSALTLKDIFINNEYDLYGKYAGYVSNLNNIKAKSLTQAVKDFITSDLFNKRLTIIQLLLDDERYDNLYLAYLLYDLLSNDANNNVDTLEQNMLLDSLPWTIKNSFKDAMKKTIQYTNDLSNFDINKIPIEQQICLMKAPDQVKEKAMQKLKEVKAKSEDSGSKARQYLDGLLKIPFGIYKKEPILTKMDTIKRKFNQYINSNNSNNSNYTSLEIINHIKKAKKENKTTINIDEYLLDKDKTQLIALATKINLVIANDSAKAFTNVKQIKYSGKKKDLIKAEIKDFLQNADADVVNQVVGILDNGAGSKPVSLLDDIENDYLDIKNYINGIKDTLDKSVYCHENAKKQIERIIGQWITGENKAQTVLGFEGAPGLGKTTLAKGLANCLKDENNQSRPFALIAIGGDTNSSTLVGHSYTYVGSTWGQIVQILMDKKCMNPIILIDEVDKISRTEHGKEIIGVLTHLLDTTQNDTFQDKYFSGIELDLSKALFILSYNDVSALDRVMLDRITRVKFDSLSVEDKIVIANKHLLPEIYKNIGLIDTISFSDETLKFIIEEYTLEAGVRKLKEVLTELCREINLEILKDCDINFEKTIVVSIDDIKTKYFKEKQEVIVRKVFTTSEVGYVNGMYATALGNGGTLPIHAKFFPSNKFLELKLTGLQQDVMRESMNVALTVAWNLTSKDIQQQIRKNYGHENNLHSVNIHTGDGAVSKDGPSAGCAITCALYSLLNNIPIKPEFGITGEIQMSGHITAIGGLSSKILGSIKAGANKFIYPKENQKDFDKFYNKYKNNEVLTNIKFYPVDHVNEALELLLDK